MVEAVRKSPLSHTSAGSATVRLSLAPAASRVSLRAKPDAIAAVAGALGFNLPERPKTSNDWNGSQALWLGPDEWLLIGPEGTDFVGMAARSGVLHSAVDVSHRNIGILVSGPGAAAAINAGCPHDLSDTSFPVGACARTVLGKMEIVLHRTGAEDYRVECWRSFGEYCLGMLAEGAADADL